jgi:ribonucleoside-diphosphate reductase alpha chain
MTLLYSAVANAEAEVGYCGDILLRVKKRDGSLVEVNPEKIKARVAGCSEGLAHVDPNLVAEKAIGGLHDAVSTEDLDRLLIQTAAMLISEDPDYSKVAQRLLHVYAMEEAATLGIRSFSDGILYGVSVGILSEEVKQFTLEHKIELNSFVDHTRTDIFEYFGLKTVYDRYLLRDPKTRKVIETPQAFFLRVAVGLSKTLEEAKEFYDLISSFEYMPSTPTLFNSGTRRPQMSSCYLMDSPKDDLTSIYEKYKDSALLSKFAGGLGMAYHRVRSRGSLINGTNGKSNGIVPFLKTLDSSVQAVNQGGKRKGACCVYLETWHADIFDFLMLRENTGDESQRTYNLNLANWVPDLFMKRVDTGEDWSLFDPVDVPHLTDLYGEKFENAYLDAEMQGLAKRTVGARELYGAMMKSLAQTGNGWMTFKDASNLKSNQTGYDKNTIHLSNLCTEILEVTNDEEVAVCNLGSINIGRHVKDGDIDYDKLAKNVYAAVKYLDRVVDINFYPITKAQKSNSKWRPIGLGLMGLQDVFFKLGIPFDSKRAREISKKVQEEIYYHALSASCELAKDFGAHPNFYETRASKGFLQFDLWGVKPSDSVKWDLLKGFIDDYGLRNSLVVAIAPTATIASITGAYECIEPQISNLFKRETLSGEFLQVNSYLISELKALGLWTKEVRDAIKLSEGSIQTIEAVPSDVKKVFRTVWEIPMKSLIDMASDRGPYIDQSQSLNLFIENPTIGKLSSMYHYAWKKGLKTTYYLRSRAATKINKTTVSNVVQAIACSLENPESCESCQ